MMRICWISTSPDKKKLILKSWIPTMFGQITASVWQRRKAIHRKEITAWSRQKNNSKLVTEALKWYPKSSPLVQGTQEKGSAKANICLFP